MPVRERLNVDGEESGRVGMIRAPMRESSPACFSALTLPFTSALCPRRENNPPGYMQPGRRHRHGGRAARQPGRRAGGMSLFGDDFFDLLDSTGFEDDHVFGLSRSSPSTLGSALGGGRAVKAAPIERKLPCTLEELYAGTTRRMKITRLIADASGSGGTVTAEEILTIDVKPGWKKGTKNTFPERGNEQPNTVPADLVFVNDEKPHPVFARDGNDLVATYRMPLAEARTGRAVHLTALGGRSLTVTIRSAIRPGYEEVVRGEGMLVPRNRPGGAT